MTVKVDSTTLRKLLASITASPESLTEDTNSKPEEAPLNTKTNTTLPAFHYKGVDVPDLEYIEDDMGFASTAKLRSPYNKVRFRANLDIFPTDTSVWTLAKFHLWALENLVGEQTTIEVEREEQMEVEQSKVEQVLNALPSEVREQVVTLLNSLVSQPEPEQPKQRQRTKVKDVPFTKANGEVIYGSAEEVAAWTAGAERLRALNAAKKVTITPESDVQALLTDPDAIKALIAALR